MNDEDYINRCIELAIKGKGKVSTNPMVGAVIVYNDTIIGEGFHAFYGGPHAEVNAINNVADPSLLEHSTIYVSLEPCSHHGKTPPCSQLIIEKKIKRVVIGCVDTYSEVAGRGIEHLKQAGIEVKVGVLENECRFLNRRFFTFHEKKRPYVILKWAQSKDGFIDKKRITPTREVNWISQPETQLKVHQWRSEEDAILVGKNTTINDNPRLTTRKFKGKNPKRILLDSNLEVDLNSQIFSEDTPTFVINLKQSIIEKNTTWIQVADMSPASILKELYKLDIQSVIIEGGKATIDSFIDANLWDEARVIEGAVLFEKGLKAPTIQSPNTTTFPLGKDKFSVYLNDSLIPLKNIHYDFI